MFIDHTFKISSFFLCLFIGNFFCTGFFTLFYIFYIQFRPFIQFHLYNSFISVNQNCYLSHVLLSSLSCWYFFQIKVLQLYLLSKFSYLDQFYRFTCIIHLYHFITMFLYGSLQKFYRNKFFRTVLLQFYCIANLVIQSNFIFTPAILISLFYYNFYPSHYFWTLKPIYTYIEYSSKGRYKSYL